MSHEDSSTAKVPARGSMVVYAAGRRQDGNQRFRVADVVGPAMVDPVTGHIWLGVLLPDRPSRADLIDTVSVKNVVPPD